MKGIYAFVPTVIMKRFSGVYIVGGGVRRVILEAEHLEEARQVAQRWAVGIEGEAPDRPLPKPVEPEAFNLDDTRRLLGGVSRATIYRWCWEGRLQRVPNTGRLLITRKSIERFCESTGN